MSLTPEQLCAVATSIKSKILEVIDDTNIVPEDITISDMLKVLAATVVTMVHMQERREVTSCKLVAGLIEFIEKSHLYIDHVEETKPCWMKRYITPNTK